MTQNRNISDVLEIIHRYIPEDQSLFIAYIKNIKSSIDYAPPEIINSSHYWIKLSDTINQLIPDKYQNLIGWEKNIIDTLLHKYPVTYDADVNRINTDNKISDTRLTDQERNALMQQI